MHKFLKKRYEEHLEQFDVIGEFVRSMVHDAPCAWTEGSPADGVLPNVDSHDGRAMLLTYPQNCVICVRWFA